VSVHDVATFSRQMSHEANDGEVHRWDDFELGKTRCFWCGTVFTVEARMLMWAGEGNCCSDKHPFHMLYLCIPCVPKLCEGLIRDWDANAPPE
jgi:hypothetical protein